MTNVLIISTFNLTLNRTPWQIWGNFIGAPSLQDGSVPQKTYGRKCDKTRSETFQ